MHDCFGLVRRCKQGQRDFADLPRGRVLRLVRAQEVVVEDNGVHRLGLHEED